MASRSYTQGYSKDAISTHLQRTAEEDAAFLLRRIKATDRVLDVGCGPGTITLSLARYLPQGSIIGVDISTSVLDKAKELLSSANLSNASFEQGDVLEGLHFANESFDIVFSSQVLGHMPTPELAVQAITEMRRLLKPGGILAARDGITQLFFPKHLDIDCLWGRNQLKAINKGDETKETIGSMMPALLRRAGFAVDTDKVVLGAGNKVFAGQETRRFLGGRSLNMLKEGEVFRQSWLDAGISEDEIEETRRAIEQWIQCEDAWMCAVNSEVLAWK